MIVQFNKNFYSVEAIKEALKDFREVCNGIIIKDMHSLIELELEPLEPKEIDENLGEEFCNYVLGLMKNKFLV